jgi:AraC family transcriptional regulator, exoenzyme S synthesis regulatory protein ExsA
MELHQPNQPIVYYSDTEVHRSEDEYIREHVLCYILDGELKMQDADAENIYGKGATLLIRKNHLVKCEKRPSKMDGRYQIFFIVLSSETLQQYLISERLSSHF